MYNFLYHKAKEMKISPKLWQFNELRVNKILKRKPVLVSLHVLMQAAKEFEKITAVAWDIHYGKLDIPSDSNWTLKQLNQLKDQCILEALRTYKSEERNIC